VNALAWLLRRELIRFLRRPSQLVSTLATPVVVWAFLAAGFANATTQGTYAAHLAPGMAILVVMFSTVFVGMSLIEDRHMGFLQGVLVSPAPRSAIAGGKLAAAALLGAIQGIPLLLVSPFLGVETSALGLAVASAGLMLTAAAVGGFGLALAWWIDSSRGYHGLLTTLIMPLWLLSGSLFPRETAAGWIVFIEQINPVGWCRTTIEAAMTGSLQHTPFAALGCAAFAAAGIAAAVATLGNAPRASEG